MIYKVKRGFKLNPNKRLVGIITDRIHVCGGECPCSNDGVDKMCPCSDYLMNDNCHCNLYVKDDYCEHCHDVIRDENFNEIESEYCCKCGRSLI